MNIILLLIFYNYWLWIVIFIQEKIIKTLHKIWDVDFYFVFIFQISFFVAYSNRTLNAAKIEFLIIFSRNFLIIFKFIWKKKIWINYSNLFSLINEFNSRKYGSLFLMRLEFAKLTKNFQDLFFDPTYSETLKLSWKIEPNRISLIEPNRIFSMFWCFFEFSCSKYWKNFRGCALSEYISIFDVT